MINTMNNTQLTDNELDAVVGGSIFDDIGDWFSDAADEIGDGLSDAFGSVENGIEALGPAISKFEGVIADGFEMAMDALG